MSDDKKPAPVAAETKKDVVKAAAEAMKDAAPSPEQAAQPQQLDPRLEYANTMHQIVGVLSAMKPGQELLDRFYKEKFISGVEYRNAMTRMAAVPRALNLFAGQAPKTKAAPQEKTEAKPAEKAVKAEKKDPVIVNTKGEKIG